MALVLAIMALMLLTFLGLTLATTTSTELQIATNYRWSQQALYNAEAGLEAAKAILRNMPVTTSWATLLPAARTGGTWTPASSPGTAGMPSVPGGMPALDDWGSQVRNFENQDCDGRGGSVGYGVILNDNVSAAPQGLMQNKTEIFGQRLNGAVTVWVRRDFRVADNGTISDDPVNTALIITAEGVAPYSDGSAGTSFARANQAVRLMESAVLRAEGGAEPCEAYRAQTGGGVTGSNFASCAFPRGGQECRAGELTEFEQDVYGSLNLAARSAQGTAGEQSGRASGAPGSFISEQKADGDPGDCVE